MRPFGLFIYIYCIYFMDSMIKQKHYSSSLERLYLKINKLKLKLFVFKFNKSSYFL